jgi:hypothetical protein
MTLKDLAHIALILSSAGVALSEQKGRKPVSASSVDVVVSGNASA